MKRLVAALALVSLLAVPASASADKPDKFPAPPAPFDLPAGTVCPFAIHAEYPSSNAFEIDHVDRLGNLRWAFCGGKIFTRVTNLSNGHSVDLNITGPGKITVADDGSLTVDGTGHWLVGFFPGDSPSTALILYSGHIVFDVSPTGQVTLLSYVGAPPQDVCAMIA
jgi:hypothetical protein